MPRSRRKKDGRGSSGQRRIGQSEADVTLDDFANSRSTGTKMKKAATNVIVREVKQLSCKEEDELDWFEKDLEQFELMPPDDDKKEIEEQTNERKSQLKSSRKWSQRRRRQENVDSFAEDGCSQYPIDVWYLIAEYINPEDIATFACICKDALAVVKSMKFWLMIYKRYYQTDANLPERLRPECMQRPRSLRACVIRSLYYTYPLFVRRVNRTSPFDENTHTLLRSRCILMWHQKLPNMWNFFFKFRSDGKQFTKPDKKDWICLLEDIHANPEAGCQVLQVSCKHFIPTPVVMGMVLANVNLNTSRKMHHYRLRLTFDATHYFRSTNGVLITLEPVANIRVLNWWHPQYPYYSA